MRDHAKKLETTRQWANSETGRKWRAKYLAGRKEQVSAQNRKYRSAHRDHLNKKNRSLRQGRKTDPVAAPYWVRQKMLRDAEKRAAERGMPFSISLEHIGQPSVCPVLGIPIVWTLTRPAKNSPSLDRLVNTLGYVPGNVWVISRRANAIKNDASPDELRRVADAVEARLSGGVEAWPREFPR